MKSAAGLAALFVGMVAAGAVAAWAMGLLSGAPTAVAVLACVGFGAGVVSVVVAVAWRLARWLES